MSVSVGKGWDIHAIYGNTVTIADFNPKDIIRNSFSK